jgi:hypothetical protein
MLKLIVLRRCISYAVVVRRLFLVLIVLGVSLAHAQTGNCGKNPGQLHLIKAHKGPVIGPDHPDVIKTNNKSGFETGQVVKINGVYHMFVNEMFIRPHRDLRISYWTSPDAVCWKRQSTIVESIPGRSPTNPRSEVWLTGVEFNECENAWNIFYVAYRSGDAAKGEIARSDYSGRIWRAKSVKSGIEGIAGPYADMGIILQPDENTQPWEGQQAVASFNPYKVGEKWYAFYDGHNYIPLTGWPTGLAVADKLEGPWKRLPEEKNPLKIVDHFMENAVISRMNNGKYLAVYDSYGDQEIGYSISEDGLNWSKEVRIKIQFENDLWGKEGDHAMRTPLCAIEEEDGTFTVVYTSLINDEDNKFYAIGKCTLAWKKEQ